MERETLNVSKIENSTDGLKLYCAQFHMDEQATQGICFCTTLTTFNWEFSVHIDAE